MFINSFQMWIEAYQGLSFENWKEKKIAPVETLKFTVHGRVFYRNIQINKPVINYFWTTQYILRCLRMWGLTTNSYSACELRVVDILFWLMPHTILSSLGSPLGLFKRLQAILTYIGLVSQAGEGDFFSLLKCNYNFFFSTYWTGVLIRLVAIKIIQLSQKKLYEVSIKCRSQQ